MPYAAEIRTLAHYNHWANCRLYDAAARLTPEQLAEDRRGFFSSVLGGLNHILVADRIWLNRFEGLPAASLSLDTILFDTLPELRAAREAEDRRIARFATGLTDEMLSGPFRYRNLSGKENTLPFGDTLLHVFNHHTHHRGQVTTLLTQAGLDYPPLDYLYFILDETKGSGVSQAPEAGSAPAG